MKKLLSISMLFLTFHGMAQNKKVEQPKVFNYSKKNFLYTGINVGYITKVNVPSVELNAGVKASNFNGELFMLIPATTLAYSPKMFGGKLGYQISNFKPFVGYSFQTVGQEVENKFIDTPYAFINGWRMCYGLSYYSKTIPLSLTIEQLGKYTNASIGCYVTF